MCTPWHSTLGRCPSGPTQDTPLHILLPSWFGAWALNFGLGRGVVFSVTHQRGCCLFPSPAVLCITIADSLGICFYSFIRHGALKSCATRKYRASLCTLWKEGKLTNDFPSAGDVQNSNLGPSKPEEGDGFMVDSRSCECQHCNSLHLNLQLGSILHSQLPLVYFIYGAHILKL